MNIKFKKTHVLLKGGFDLSGTTMFHVVECLIDEDGNYIDKLGRDTFGPQGAVLAFFNDEELAKEYVDFKTQQLNNKQ